MRARRPLYVLAGLAALLLAADQLVLRAFLGDGEFLGRRIAPFDPPLFSVEQRQAFERLRAALAAGRAQIEDLRFDPELGWRAPRDRPDGPDPYDALGTRIAHRPLELARRAGVRRIVAIGCSFTEGAEVAAREAWCGLLEASIPNLEVANLGVGAYGLDQALLRWRKEGRALAGDEVWLGWLPSATPRLVTLYRPAERHWGQLVAFKPRFVLGADGALEFVPCPAGDPRAVHDLILDSRAFLAATRTHDAWVAACPAAYAPTGSHVLHHSFAGRLALTVLERRGRDVHARLADAADELPRLVEALVLATRAEVEASGARFRLLILPGRDDLRAASAEGSAPWAEISARLLAQGVALTDLSPALLAAGGAAEDSLWMPGGHYSPAANARVAAELSTLAR